MDFHDPYRILLTVVFDMWFYNKIIKFNTVWNFCDFYNVLKINYLKKQNFFRHDILVTPKLLLRL